MPYTPLPLFTQRHIHAYTAQHTHLQHLGQDVYPGAIVGGAGLHSKGHTAQEGRVDVHGAVSGAQHNNGGCRAAM